MELKGEAFWHDIRFPEGLDHRCPLELQGTVSWYTKNYDIISSTRHFNFSGKAFWKRGARGPSITGAIDLSELSLSEYEHDIEIMCEIENNSKLAIQGLATWNWEEWPRNRQGTFYWQWIGEASKYPGKPHWSINGNTTKGWGQFPPLLTEKAWKP